MNFLVLFGITAGTLLVALAVGRYHHRSRLEQWRELLEPSGDGALQALGEGCALDSAMAEDAYLGAIRARSRAPCAPRASRRSPCWPAPP